MRIRRSRLLGLVLVAGVVLVALNMRPSITAVGPIVAEIRSEYGLSAAAAGMLTTLPVLCFGLFAPFAPRLGLRYGIEAVLVVSMACLAAGILIRWISGILWLFAGTVILGAAIAAANVLLPSLIKRDFPTRLGPMTAGYSAMLGGAAAIGSGVSAPLAGELGWSASLAVWAFPAAVVAALLLSRWGERDRPDPALDPARGLRELWTSPIAWQVTLFWAMQSFGFFITVAWVPEVLIDAGKSAENAGFLLLLSQLVGVAAALGVPALLGGRADQRAVVVAASAAIGAGVCGLILADSGVVLWMMLLGLGQGASLSLALLFFVMRSREHRTAAELSGMAQAVGYVLAASGPVLAGLLHDLSGGWTPVLILLLLAAVVQLTAGMGAGRDVFVRRQPATGLADS